MGLKYDLKTSHQSWIDLDLWKFLTAWKLLTENSNLADGISVHIIEQYHEQLLTCYPTEIHYIYKHHLYSTVAAEKHLKS